MAVRDDPARRDSLEKGPIGGNQVDQEIPMTVTTGQRPLNVVAVVLVASDRAHQGTYQDRSGPAAAAWLMDQGMAVQAVTILPDDRDALTHALDSCCARLADELALVVISGGTGLGPRDVTPQVLNHFADYEIPGFGELLRRESLRYSLNAYLSRCGGWVRSGVLILALPGNPKAVVEQLEILRDLLPHALKSLKGRCDHRRPPVDSAATSSAPSLDELAT